MKFFVHMKPATRLKTCKNLFASVLPGSPPAHRPTGPTGELIVLQVASPLMAVTGVVRATWQDHGKFFDRGKEPVQNVIPLFHTHLPLHWPRVVQCLPCKKPASIGVTGTIFKYLFLCTLRSVCPIWH